MPIYTTANVAQEEAVSKGLATQFNKEHDKDRILGLNTKYMVRPHGWIRVLSGSSRVAIRSAFEQ